MFIFFYKKRSCIKYLKPLTEVKRHIKGNTKSFPKVSKEVHLVISTGGKTPLQLLVSAKKMYSRLQESEAYYQPMRDNSEEMNL